MKRLLALPLLAGFLVFAAGCDDDDGATIGPVIDPPEPPQGVFSVTGDQEVTIVWNGPYVRDIASFTVFRSFFADSGYVAIGSVVAQNNPNLDLIQYEYTDATVANGTTYYYAVASVDGAGREGPLSAEFVVDTPRPEDVVTLFDIVVQPSLAGFDFSAEARLDTAAGVDIFIDRFDGIFYINAGLNVDLQDMGFTGSFDEIGFAPDQGWSLLGFSELILGHTYVIWTADDQYAKVRVLGINDAQGSVQLEWAYQTSTDPDWRFELTLPPTYDTRPERPPTGTPKRELLGATGERILL